MNSNQKTARIIGVLFLLIFAIGVTMYQFLQSPLFADNFITATAANATNIIISTVLGIVSGLISIMIAILLVPIFKQYSYKLALTYVAFCILSCVMICIDNISVLSLLDLSQAYVKGGGNTTDLFKLMGTLLYERHAWTHYLSLLVSCFPVFVLYFTMYASKLIPKVISIFGMLAATLMLVEMTVSIFGHSISMNMMIPMALIQLILPIWLLIKGFNSSKDIVLE
ncbi:DUF4386 domain-containing protein [uncultured Kordia sp.]|uniref:DUF4386 domain-containing protein n=1 Tax=uncultured Kordia sp. TaxID=507699 RepID=UPI002618680D|nr:DUF4386 domain-containing protein [uncultured Kordia sp.]